MLNEDLELNYAPNQIGDYFVNIKISNFHISKYISLRNISKLK